MFCKYDVAMVLSAVVKAVVIVMVATLVLFALMGTSAAGQVIGEPNANGWYIYDVPIHVSEGGCCGQSKSYIRHEYWLYREVERGTLVGPGCQLNAAYRGVSNPDGWNLDARCVFGRKVRVLDVPFEAFASTFPEVTSLAQEWSDLLVLVMYGKYGRNQVYLLSTTENNSRENAEIWYQLTGEVEDAC